MLFCSAGIDGPEESKNPEEDYPASKMKTTVDSMVTEEVVPKKDAKDYINEAFESCQFPNLD